MKYAIEFPIPPGDEYLHNAFLQLVEAKDKEEAIFFAEAELRGFKLVRKHIKKLNQNTLKYKNDWKVSEGWD